MSITNGTVEFTRWTAIDDYQQKKAKVSLSFDNEDEAGIDRICGMVIAKALVMVDDHTSIADLPRSADTLKVVVAEKTWEGPKAGKPVSNLADIMGEVVPNPTVTAVPPAASIAEPEAVAPQPVVTDKRLTDEVSAHNARLITAAGSDDTQRQLATQRVLKLVDEYTQLPPGPGRLSKVPQEKRAAFLEALGRLT